MVFYMLLLKLKLPCPLFFAQGNQVRVFMLMEQLIKAKFISFTGCQVTQEIMALLVW